MKKLIVGLLIGLFILTGCKTAPKEPAVMQIDLEQMLDTARQDSGESENEGPNLREQFGIPETYQFEAMDASGKLRVCVNASVIVPNKCALPIYEVNAADFTQAQVAPLWRELIGSTEMWEQPTQRTKAQIAEEIRDLKLLMTDEKKLDSYRMMNLEEAEEELERLEELYKSAPDKIEEKRSYGKIDECIAWENPEDPSSERLGIYTGFSAYEKYGDRWGKDFQVRNNTDMKKTFERKDGHGGSSIYYPMRNADMSYSDNRIARSPTEPALSLEQAKAMVQDLLDKTGCGMIIDNAFLKTDYTYFSSGETWVEMYYAIHCTREVEGVPVAYIEMGSNIGERGKPSTWGYWGYEDMIFQITDEGIRSMSWVSPLTVTRMVNGNSQLLPFSEIREVFEKMILITSAKKAEKYGYETSDIEIDRVTLSLQRIAKQNSIEEGFLIPVWNFYGRLTGTWGGGANMKLEYDHSVISINAIDGSVIDTEKGY